MYRNKTTQHPSVLQAVAKARKVSINSMRADQHATVPTQPEPPLHRKVNVEVEAALRTAINRTTTRTPSLDAAVQALVTLTNCSNTLLLKFL